MFQLIYTSKALPALTRSELQSIADRARVLNSLDGLTGVLLMADGIVMQVLEGSEEKVRRLYRKIQRDKRHKDCEILLTRHCERRQFPDWSMGCCEQSDGAFQLRVTIADLRERQNEAGFVQAMAGLSSHHGTEFLQLGPDQSHARIALTPVHESG